MGGDSIIVADCGRPVNYDLPANVPKGEGRCIDIQTVGLTICRAKCF